MPPVKVLCTNCETEELNECDTGEETIYRCRGASEGEIESRSGCGAVVSFKEYRALKAAATGTSTAASKTTSSTPSAASRTPAKLHPAPTRRPLSSLHSNALHSRTPLHGRANAAAVAQTSPAPSAASPASAGPVSTPPSSTPKSTPQPPPTSTAADTDSDSSDDLGGDDDPPSSGTGARARRPPVVTSTSTTPTKLPRSGASSPVHDDGGSSGPAALGSAARMRALRLKLAKQREKSLEEFRDKYGAEGDEETEEEQAAAVRKRTGEASDDFLSCSQEEGAIARAPMVASLSIKGAENPLAGGHRRAFTLPRAHGAMSTSAKALIAERQKTIHTGRRLGARLRISSGAFTTFKPLEAPPVVEEDEGELAPPPPPKVEETKTTPDGFQPLVIWQPTPEELVANPKLTTIEVPMLVCKWLRPHQREGVKFMCECVLGQRNLGPSEEKTTPPPPSTTDADGNTCTPATQTALTSMGGGAILADDMGLGKTLQSVALVYTLLTQGFEVGSPVARKVIIVTPTSLVSNWNNELDKWLGKGRVNTVALSEVGKDNISCGIDTFVGRGSKTHVLIISYDCFRRNVDRLNKPGLCDLLICDEAHRLKNNKTSTYTTLDSLPCRRRVLLSGTPMQNDLSEFFSMINFTNRNILGDRRAFRKYYELPILLGREPDCLERDAEEGSERAAELSAIVNQFVLRRTNMLLRAHLPPKVIQVVCCRPSDLQLKLYQHFLKSKSVKKLTGGDDEGGGRGGGGGLQALPLITSLKKLCNHPKLIWDTAQAAAAGGSAKKLLVNEDGVAEKVPPALLSLFKGLAPIFHAHEGGAFVRNPSDARFSGKMFVLERLLTQIRVANSGERVVIVSNFTSALDVIATMCAARRWDCLRLDGTTSIKNRQKLVDQLSDRRGNKVFVFLLSSRAGGCGLNLVGANRLILFDPDWNPAVDKQAAARVWRDGQTRRCFVYRFLTTSSIEEKVYQRQLSKEGLSGVLGGSTADASLTKDELRDLFTLDDLEQPSDTHKSLECECIDKFQIRTEAEATRAEEMQRQEAEAHVKLLADEAARAQAEGATAEGEGEGESKENGAAHHPITPVEGDAAKMEDVEPGAPVAPAPEGDTAGGEGEEGDGDGDGDGSAPSSSSDDEEMNDFIAKSDDDGDDDEADYGGKSKKKKAAPKASRKDGPRKQRKKRAAIGSLNFPAMHALPACTLGQRGEPPEEELINWAHHATSNSIPDPLFRAAARTMPFTRGHLPFVSFVFSCEVSGKEILNSTDTADAAAVSARCEAAPTAVQASKPIAVTLESALARHADFMANERARKKKSGADELEERLADPSKRRHSSRVATRNDHAEETPDEDDMDFIGDDGEDGASTDAGEGQTSRKRKAGPAADVDEASLALIRQLQAEDAGLARKRGGGGGGKKTKQPPPPTVIEESPDALDMEDDTPPPPQPPPPPSPRQTAQAASPLKKQKVVNEPHVHAPPPAAKAPVPHPSPKKTVAAAPAAAARSPRATPKPAPAPVKKLASPKKTASPAKAKKGPAPMPVDAETSSDDSSSDDDDSSSDSDSDDSDVLLLDVPPPRAKNAVAAKPKPVAAAVKKTASPAKKPQPSPAKAPKPLPVLDDEDDDFMED